MQPVHGAAFVGRRRLAAAAIAVAVLAVAVVLAAVSASGGDGQASEERVALLSGEGLQSARCRDWQQAGARERERVVETLAQVVGGASDAGGRGTTLPAQEAHQLFDRTCAAPQARGFLLYSIYTKAAAFQYAPQRFQ